MTSAFDAATWERFGIGGCGFSLLLPETSSRAPPSILSASCSNRPANYSLPTA